MISAVKDPAFVLAIQISLHVVRTLQELNFIAHHADKSSTNGNFTMPSAGCIYGYMRVLFYLLKLEPDCCVHLHETLAIPEGECAENSRWKSEEDACWCLTSCYQFVDDKTCDFAKTIYRWSRPRVKILEVNILTALDWEALVPISELARPRKSTCDGESNRHRSEH